jgi:hypothetical protein
MPLIGDNDDGMAVKLRGYRPHTDYMFEVADVLHDVPHGLPIRFDEPLDQITFEEFGLDAFVHDRFVLTVRCGPIGQYGKGGHAHNDQNAITLSVDGQPVIIDPGSSWYGDPVIRNNDRSVTSHATVVVNNEEQNLFPGGRSEAMWWLMGDRTQGRVITRNKNNWEGAINASKGEYRRTIRIDENDEAVVITIHDQVPTGAYINVPVAPEAECQLTDDTAVLRFNNLEVQLAWDGVTKAVREENSVRYARRYSEPELTDTLRLEMEGLAATWTITLPK